VYLVGAGPGHPELLTLKAADLLKTGDVIVYDRLIQEEVLALAKPSAERIFMGKSVGRHDSRQDEIHDLLVQKAREGKTVVRLKGGDPFVFGRGGEEAEHLADHGIPFEVIPGVSSALAAPLSAGIAVTHRHAASVVAIVTGHEAKKDQDRLDWWALARVDTLVFLMAVANVSRIAELLVSHGRRPDTPAAVVQMAFWHDEQAVTATLGTIARAVEVAGVKPPATLVVGDVVRLHEKLKHSARDLRRRADGSSRFEPAPGTDQLLRLATGAAGSQLLGFALDISLFDQLERPRTAAHLAALTGSKAAALEEILDALVAVGLVESTRDGYRNLEVASRYLRRASQHSLGDTLLHQVSLSTSWQNLAAYARTGQPDERLATDGRDVALARGAEALARFTAPAVVERLDLSGRGPVLHVGWGGSAYADAIGRRWPHLPFTTCNPFLARDRRAALDGCSGSSYGSVLVSGLLGSCRRGEVDEVLAATSAALSDGGLLVVHDGFLPGSALPPADLVLGALARHVASGGCRTWSTSRLTDALQGLGFTTVRTEPLVAGTLLVRAERGSRQ
jgi:uroporphyrin-III C-methyltransferase